MRTVQRRLHVPHQSARAAFDTLADFERYPELSEAVRSVQVTAVSDHVTISEWEVTFRAGVLRWTEQDEFDPAALTITFHQLAGDIALFDGSWACSNAENGGTDVAFSARLDMGIPSLADALEPIAVRALVDNTVSILNGLVGVAELVASEVTVPGASAE